MTLITSTGSGLLDRIAASRAAPTYRPAGMTAQAASAAAKTVAATPTRVTLDAASPDTETYAKPKALNLGAQRFWATAREDSLSEQMARNSGKDAATLSDRWRGLGGGLLKQLAATGEGYKQTLADYVPPATAAEGVTATEGTSATDTAAAVAALREQAVGGVATNAAEVSLKIQTRSGHTVELTIGVNSGDQGGTRGLQVEIKSSGALSSAERKALASLSDGLDRALEGLGEGAPTLDLSGLTGFDQDGVLTGLDLKVGNPNARPEVPGAMQSFAVHLGTDTKSLSLRTTSGEMNLEVDATQPKGAVNNGQRRSAIDQLLKQIDAAADRGHADAAMTKAFKDAFELLQAPPVDADAPALGTGSRDDANAKSMATGAPKLLNAASDPTAAATPTTSDGLRSQVEAMQSGLADFKAEFSADSQRKSRIGSVKEAGHADYKISQTTTDRPNNATGGRTITQTQTEEMDASFQKSRSFTLDRDSGNYDATTVQDKKTVTTMIDTVKDSISRAMRKTDEDRRKTFTQIENFKTTQHNEWPSQRSFVERLR